MGQLIFQATLGGQVALVGPNTASSYTINVPTVNGNLVTTGDTGTVTNTMLANSSVTIGSTALSLGGTASTIAGLTLTSPTINGGTSTATQNLANVTGTLSIINGGSGLSSYSLGQIFFGATSNFGQSANLYWDNTNNRLGLGTSSPSYALDIAPSSSNVISRVLATGTSSNAYSIYTSTNAVSNPVTLYVGSLGSSVGALIGTYTNSDLVFGTNNQTNIMRFNTSGILSVPTLNLTNALTVPYGGTGLTSLTSGYIPYGNGTSAFSSSSGFTFDGNNLSVGNGYLYAKQTSVSSSTQQLDLRNSANTALQGYVYGPSSAGYGAASAGEASVYTNAVGLTLMTDNASGIIKFATGGSSEKMRLTSAGYLGIGTTSPAYTLDINTGAQTNSFRILSYADPSKNFYISNNNGVVTAFADGANASLNVGTTGANAFIFTTNNTERMRLDSSGNLGLGVTPSAFSNSGNLQLAANKEITSLGNGLNLFSNHYYNAGDKFAGTGYAMSYQMYSGIHSWYTSTASGTAGNAITFTQAMTLDASGNLLVGTTSTSSSSGVGFKVVSPTANHWDPLVVTSANSSGASCWDIYSTATSSYRFYVTTAGVVNAVSTSITAISDQRLKENVRDLDLGLAEVMALQPRRYDWKEGKGQDKKDAVGFIAQEFETVLPNSVGTSKAGEDGIEYKNINYEELVPTLVKAIQELKAEVDSLKQQLGK